MIEFVLAVLWYIRILRNILSYVHLWFVKEYRVDRMLIHLKTKQGKHIYFPERKEPPISPKTVALVILLVISTLTLIVYLPIPLLVRVFIADMLAFPLSFFFVILLRVPTLLYHVYIIGKARKCLSLHRPMMTIGITGSFGKTSTKDFLATILKEKYKVLKTEESKNSRIGISETVLRYLSKAHTAFVVEMGAYKRGEIEGMVNLVHPNVAVVTAINAQHQDLFGSIETTKKAKYELIEGLPLRGGIAVMNLDNDHVRAMAGWAIRDGITVWGVTSDQTYRGPVKHVFVISNPTSTKDTITFDYTWKKKHVTVRASIRGEHFVMNIALAIAAAVAGGLTFPEAVKGAGKIQPVHRVMEIAKGLQGQTIINDTFNNNPDAAKAALSYLAKYNHKRVLVFQPMIELGKYSEKAHEDVGFFASKICDAIILTNTNFSEAFMKGARKGNAKKKVQIFSKDEAIQYLSRHTKEKDTILFKGKEAALVCKGLIRS